MKDIHISRRDLLRAGGLAAAYAALAACGPLSTALQPLTGTDNGSSPAQTGSPEGNGNSTDPTESGAAAFPEPTTTPWPAPAVADEDALLVHTVRRMSFGMSPGQLARAREIGLEAYVDEQLNPESIDDARVEALIAPYEVLQRSALELLELLEQEQRRRQRGEFMLVTVLRQRFSERQFYEAVVDLWTNHFNIYIRRSGPTGLLKIIDDAEVIRPYALTTFPELVAASAHSPAMLMYLDQNTSRAGNPNENYARELLELHTVGVDGGYTQQDVEEAARALTGWSVVRPRDAFFGLGNEDALGFKYRPGMHDDGEKRIMGLTLPAGGGQDDGDQLLAYLAAHPSTARFVSYKLAVRFVADEPPQSIVDQLAQTYSDSDGDIKSMLRTLIASPEFAASTGMKVKRPLEFFVSALRVTNTEISGRPRIFGQLLEQMGQVPYGWATPDGYPDYAAWWTTTSGLLSRWNLALMVLTGAIPGVAANVDPVVTDGQSSEDIVDLLSLEFLGELLPADARAVLVDFAATGELGANIPLVAALILGSPHFQVR